MALSPSLSLHSLMPVSVTHTKMESSPLFIFSYFVPSKGSILFQEGERDSYLVIITNGKALVTKDDGSGKMKEIATIRSGALLGEMSIIDDFPHSATVITTENSEIALLTKANLKNITEKYPVLGVKLLWQIAWQLSARLRQASGKLVDHIE